MARITYLDPEDAAPKIEWMGIRFRAMVPTEVDEEKYAWLVDKARTHPHFRVEDAAAHQEPPPFEPDKPLPPLEKPPPSKKPAGKPTLTAEQLQQLAQNRARMAADLAAQRAADEGEPMPDPEP